MLLYPLPLTEASACFRTSILDACAYPFWALIVIIAFEVAFFVVDMYLLKYRKI